MNFARLPLRWQLFLPRALLHRLRYKFLRRQYPKMLTHGGIELTNTCNLNCKDCPTPRTGAPRGFADDATVRLAMRYARPGQLFSLHRLGEPLLHPSLVKYVRWAAGLGLQPLVSTNGLLLDEATFHRLMRAGLANLQITLHTKKSVAALKLVTDCLCANPAYARRLTFCGNLLSHNPKAQDWLKESAFSPQALGRIRHVAHHSWAGGLQEEKKELPPEEVRRRKALCCFIRSNIASVRWDGAVVACCFDSENVQLLGHLRDFPRLKHEPERYTLCNYCDADWVLNG
jgi:organic radical activating enzyme